MKGDRVKIFKSRGVYDPLAGSYTAEALAVQNGTIAAADTFAALASRYPGAEIEDTGDCFLLPGMVNTHVHLEFEPVLDTLPRYMAEDPQVNFLRAAANAAAMLRSGVTTLRDAGSSWRLLSLPGAEDFFPLPRMQLAGPPLTITGGHLQFFGCEADTGAELIKSVREHHKRGCGALKLIVSG